MRRRHPRLCASTGNPHSASAFTMQGAWQASQELGKVTNACCT